MRYVSAPVITAALRCAGCASRQPVRGPHVPPPYMNASLEQLARRLAPGGSGITSLKASYVASLRNGDGGDTQSCEGVLAMERPVKLRGKGSRAMLPTLFDLLCDGDQVTLHIPRENTVYRSGGANAQRGCGIADFRRLTEIFLGEEGTEGALHFLETMPSQYVVYTVRPEGGGAALLKKVYFDRADLSPVLYQHFDAGGRLAIEVRCGDFAVAEGGGARIPREVAVESPEAGARLSLRLRTIRVNAPLNPSLFALEVPPGARIRPLEEYGR